MKIAFAPAGKHLAGDHVLVVAPKTCFGPRGRGRGALGKWLSAGDAELAMALGGEASPGLQGGTASSRTAGGQRLTVAVLPDEVSRHNAPSRAEAIRRTVAAAGLPRAGRCAVLLVLDDAAHVLAAVNAVGRALPTFSAKSGQKPAGTLALACATANGAALPVPALARDVATTARAMAELVDTPPTDLDPQALAAAAKRLLRGRRGVTVREFVGPALLRQKLGGIQDRKSVV